MHRETYTEQRHGLVENAGGCLRCPHPGCGKPLTDVLFVALHTEYGHHMHLPLMHTFDARVSDSVPGIPGVVVGMQCPDQHHTSLSLVNRERVITVKTEWEVGKDGSD